MYDSFNNYFYETLRKIDSYYQSRWVTFLDHCIEVNVNNVEIKILQGSVVTQTVLGGLTICHPVTNFLQCVCAKNYECWLAVDNVNAVKNGCAVFCPPCILSLHKRNNHGDRSLPTFRTLGPPMGCSPPTFDNKHKLIKCHLQIVLT